MALSDFLKGFYEGLGEPIYTKAEIDKAILEAKRDLLAELMKEKFPLPKKVIAQKHNDLVNQIGAIVFKRN